MKSLIEKCLADDDLCRFIKIRARVASKVRPSTFEQEDAEQEMWEAILKHLPEFDGSVTLHSFCLSKAFSKYGNMVNPKSNLAKYENSIDHTDDYTVGKLDNSYELINTNEVLDQVEEILQYESNKRKQYQIALSSIKLQRAGFTQSETADLIGISKPYMRNIMMRTRRDLLKLVG